MRLRLRGSRGIGMGLCSGKSAVTLVPRADALGAEEGSRTTAGSRERTPEWEESSVMAHAAKTQAEAPAQGGPNPTVKGYLELGGKGEGEPAQLPRVAEEEEDTEADELEELLRFSDSEGSLKSEFLD